MRTLVLTSPPMTGEDVGRAQYILCCNNVFDQKYYAGKVDHVWGEESMRATKRARYWAGYSLADINKLQGAYGDGLDGVLTGSIEPTPAMKTLRTKRLASAGETPLREKALEEALKDVGMKENPANSNVCPISTWYGLVGPWCAMAVTWWYTQAGSKAFVKGSRYAYVPYLLADARAGRNGLAITTTPLPGDIVTYDWDRDGVPDHTGLFREGSPATFVAVEGNTSATSNSNGGEVQIRHRTGDTVAGFIHVGS